MSSTTPKGPVVPCRAPVAPRVRPASGGEAIRLEDRALRMIRANERGRVGITGPEGSGKSVALRHLAAVLPREANVRFADDGRIPEELSDGLVFFSVPKHSEMFVAQFEMAPWGDDDLIEYLLATHRPQCHGVMARIKSSAARHLALGGSPELWRMVLDVMSADASIPDVGAALRRCLAPELSDPRMRAGAACLYRLQREAMRNLPSESDALEPATRRLVSHRAVQLVLASEMIVRNLCDGTGWATLSYQLPRDLIAETARLGAHWPTVVDVLAQLLAGRNIKAHPMAASLLLALRPDWKPLGGHPTLRGAYVAGAHWAGVDLHDGSLIAADLERADLAGANLADALVNQATLREATLRGANLEKLFAHATNLAGASLVDARADGARFREADLTGADLRGARFRGADFTHADLSSALLTSANLREAILDRTKIDGADFVGADLSDARLNRLDLSESTFSATNFTGVQFHACQLEGIVVPSGNFLGAKLAGCYLTGSVMPAANFHGADLRQTGLAEISWEGADLRDADLRGSTFHMGSTRSGLVGSTVPCEGSRTGFYTDDFDDREFKNPEEIRKANLRGADLRGANVGGVDFYLVDLRGARYSAEHEQHFRKCGAILH